MILRCRPGILCESRPFPWQGSVSNKDQDSSRIGQPQENPLLETPGSQASDRELVLPPNKRAKKTSTARACQRARTDPGSHTALPQRERRPRRLCRPRRQQHTAWHLPGARSMLVARRQYGSVCVIAPSAVSSGPGHGADCLLCGPCIPSSGGS